MQTLRKQQTRQVIFLLLGFCLIFNKIIANPPEKIINYYNVQVHPEMFMSFYGDFTNMNSGVMKNGGKINYYGNVDNFGSYDFVITGYERFLGTSPQTVAGNKSMTMYAASLENSTGMILKNHLQIAKIFNFKNGIVNTNRDSLNHILHFFPNSKYQTESDTTHVNGYAAKSGNESFIFPIGNGNELHRLAMTAPVVNNLRFDAAFFNKTPKNPTIFGKDVIKINLLEYWNFKGADSVKTTLYWRKSSNIIALSADLSKLRVVGLRNGQWEDLGNTTFIGDVNEGNITSKNIFPNDYEQITIGVAEAKVVHLVVISPKAILQGPYDVAADLMQDSLRVNKFIPTKEPYTGMKGYKHVGGGGETTTATILNKTGSDAIVDWVFVTIRAAADSSQVIATKSCLIQRDADVVESDGVSPLSFTLVPGRYFVTVQHRNHLGVMTSQALTLSATPKIIDYTNKATSTYGINAQKILPNGKTVLWAGNTNLDQRIVYVGTGTDYTNISSKVLSAPANIPAYSKSYVLRGYYAEDVDMNGKVIYVGTGTDQSLISQNVLLHPENTLYSKSKPINEQLPN
jgi:hypothetical protein